jgi:two-component system, NarL family, invasion response regulator UvrY
MHTQKGNAMIRILLVDDHSIVRRGLKLIIADEADMTVVGEASNAEEMLAFVRTQPCDVVLTDIRMSGRSGLDALKELIREHPSLPVLVLSVHPEDQYGSRVLKLGASGYLTKDSAPTELVEAIRKVTKGGKYVGPSLAERLAFDLMTDTLGPPHASLSNREFQVLCLIASGKSITQIAAELVLSARTVSTYRVRILEKMGMKRTAELMCYAISHDLVFQPDQSGSPHSTPPAREATGNRSSTGVWRAKV